MLSWDNGLGVLGTDKEDGCACHHNNHNDDFVIPNASPNAKCYKLLFLQHFIGEDLKKSLELLNKAFYCYKPDIVRLVLITAL